MRAPAGRVHRRAAIAAVSSATAAAALAVARLALRVHHEKLTKTTTLTRLYGPMKRLLSNLTHLGREQA